MSLIIITILLLILLLINVNNANDAKRYSEITSITLDDYNKVNSNLSKDCHDIWPEIELFLPIHIAPRGHRNLGNIITITATFTITISTTIISYYYHYY